MEWRSAPRSDEGYGLIDLYSDGTFGRRSCHSTGKCVRSVGCEVNPRSQRQSDAGTALRARASESRCNAAASSKENPAQTA